MARQSRAVYLRGDNRAAIEGMATLASGENPDGTAFTLPTELSGGSNTIGKVDQGAAGTSAWPVTAGGYTALASATTFTRPADTTAYASGDLVANSTTAGSVTPMTFPVARVAAGSGMIRRVRLRKSGTTVTNASFRLHLYKATPTASNGDNGAWLTNEATNYLGALDVTVDKAFTDGSSGNGVPNTGSEINFALVSGQDIYGLLEARAAYTPVSAETFALALECIQN